ncbi:MAG: isoprenyl transferase [Phycisphaerales bacterium]|nr:isoprenyl transferase [Phycisphaerales bacterium]
MSSQSDTLIIPEHVAIIMDGNGRWAADRGLDRTEGHRAGTDAARTVIQTCAEMGVKVLTLYSFSTENWKRPAAEVAALMGLVTEMLPAEHETMQRNGVRFRAIGDLKGLPDDVRQAIRSAEIATRDHSRLLLQVALNYGARQEIVNAAKMLADSVHAGTLDPSEIDEAALSEHLWTAGTPDPDLLIRTGGDMRVSNFLLWQISYAEIIVSDLYWPDFDEAQFKNALAEFSQRQRRFGAV